MNTRLPLVRLLAATTLAFALTAGQASAQVTTFNDAIGDIDPSITTANGTLDIVSMEVSDSSNDVILKLTVNGNVTSPDWANLMIGIANQKTPGTVATRGNGWNRPINLNAGVTNGVTNGMTHWIGSWVSGGGGAQLWTYDAATAWQQQPTAPTILLAVGAQSSITYTVPKSSLGVTNGDTIIFDAYSSGGGDNDSAVDALANPNIAITGWGGPYTSTATNTTRSYTLANTALNTTQDITFSVNMNTQTAAANFDPATQTVSVQWGTDFVNTQPLTDSNADGIWTGTASVTAVIGSSVSYRFTIEPTPTPETTTHTFTMLTTPQALSTVYFNDIQGYRDVTFSVDMSIQVTAGTFDPIEGIVEVRGPFNDWAGTALAPVGDGVYSGTVPSIGGLENGATPYKFWATGPGYESLSDNRSFNLALNQDGSPTPAQVLVPTPNFNNATGGRQVTFTVDMTVMEALGRFTPGSDSLVKAVGNFNNWDTAGTTYQLTDPDTNGIYTGTFFLVGSEGSSLQYKFFSPGLVYYTGADAGNTGYEIISQADPLLNRTNALGPIDTPQTLGSVFFSDQLFGIMDTANFPLPASSLTNFSTTQGTPSAAQSVAVSGLQLSNNVLATAPTGFQVSLDGTNYFPSVNLVPTSGTLSSMPLFTRVASTASPGVQTNLTLSLTSVGSQFTDLRVGSSVEATAETFSNWSGGAPLTPALQLQYAIGGATSPTATNGVPSVTTVTSNTLSITAVVRTNDPTLTVNGQSLIDLAVGPWTTNNVTMTPQLDAAPEGCQVQTFSTPRGEDSKKFLRLQTTLPAEPQR
jgi:hypothetical protein